MAKYRAGVCPVCKQKFRPNQMVVPVMRWQGESGGRFIRSAPQAIETTHVHLEHLNDALRAAEDLLIPPLPDVSGDLVREINW